MDALIYTVGDSSKIRETVKILVQRSRRMDNRTAAAVTGEREEIEQYMATHGLEPQLNAVVNETVKARPEDPFAAMASLLLAKSEKAEVVLDLVAREVLSAQAYPALEVTVMTIQGSFTAMTAIGPYDGDARYDGRGMRKSVDSVHHLIRDKLVGRELAQRDIDAFLLAEANVPENAVLAVSMACCRAGAKHKDMELYAFIASIANIPDPCIPMPVFSVINGADYGVSPLHVQEVTALFAEADTFEDALEDGARLQRQLKTTLEASGYKYINGGLAGGLVPQIETAVDAIKFVQDAAGELDLKSSIKLGLDLCAHKLVEKDLDSDASGEGGGDGARSDLAVGDEGVLYNTSKWNKSLAAVQKSGEEMIDLYFEWLGRDMGLVSLEDIFHVADEGSFLKFKERLDQEIERAVAKVVHGERADQKIRLRRAMAR